MQATVSDENKTENDISPEPHLPVVTEENTKDGDHHQITPSFPAEETGSIPYKVSDEDNNNNGKSDILNNSNTDGIKTS